MKIDLVKSILLGVFVFAFSGIGFGQKPPMPPIPPPSSDVPTPGDPGSNDGLTGKEVWMKECAICHGKQGEGTERGYRLQFPSRGFATWVTRNGRVDKKRWIIDMPAYDRDMISDRQLGEMWSYLHQLPRPETGEELFQVYCANCHGVAGSGNGYARSSVRGELGEFGEAIREGEGRYYYDRRNYMPRWSSYEITSSEIRLMKDYIRGTYGGGKNRDDCDDDDDDDYYYQSRLGRFLDDDEDCEDDEYDED